MVEVSQIQLAAVPVCDRDVPSFETWMNGSFATWMNDVGRRIDAAERSLESAHAEIPSGSAPASASIGALYEGFALAYEASPYPNVLTDEDARAVFYKGIAESSTPWRLRAAAAYAKCEQSAKGAAQPVWLFFCRKRRLEAPHPVVNPSALPCPNHPPGTVIGIYRPTAESSPSNKKPH
jgi:hypothetical protein